MSQANWKKFLTDSSAPSPELDWAQAHAGLVDAWEAAPDGPGLLWLALMTAGQDTTKRRVIVRGLLDMVVSQAILVTNEELKLTFDTLEVQLLSVVESKEDDSQFVFLTMVIQAALARSNDDLLASVKVRPFVLDPQFLVVTALCNVAQVLTADNPGSALVLAQNCLGSMLGVWGRLGLIPAPGGAAEQAKKAGEMVRHHLAGYNVAAIATELNL